MPDLIDVNLSYYLFSKNTFAPVFAMVKSSKVVSTSTTEPNLEISTTFLTRSVVILGMPEAIDRL